MMSRTRIPLVPIFLVTTALVSVMLAPTPTAAREIGPEADFCSVLAGLPQGEELVLLPGDYQGPCVIRRSGEAGTPLVIRAADPGNRPRIVYEGRTSNVIEVRASRPSKPRSSS